MRNATPHEQPRVIVLDGIRGLAILLVTLYRFTKEASSGLEVGSLVRGAIQFGSSGVELFFVLSGFLITRILIDTCSSPNYFSTFFYRRSLRIFPLYFLSLLIFLWILPWAIGNPDLFAAARDRSLYLLTYTTNFKMAAENAWSFGYLDHFWSLAVEEHFYLVWPFVVLIAGKRLLSVTLFAILSTVVGRTLFCLFSPNEVAPAVLTFLRCDGLLIGSAIAVAWRSDPHRKLLQRWAPILGVVAMALVVLATLLDKRLLAIPIFLIEIAWGSLLIAVMTPNSFGRLRCMLEHPIMRSFGKYSYAMYVFQSPLIPMVALLFTAMGLPELSASPMIIRIGYVLGMFGLTWSIAYISWIAFESRLLRFRDGKPKDQVSIDELQAQPNVRPN